MFGMHDLTQDLRPAEEISLALSLGQVLDEQR